MDRSVSEVVDAVDAIGWSSGIIPSPEPGVVVDLTCRKRGGVLTLRGKRRIIKTGGTGEAVAEKAAG